MHSHLVTIEVCVERRADERVQLDSLAFDQYGLERLDAQAMQRRRAVQENRVLTNDLFENIPDFRTFALDETLGGLDRGCFTTQLQLREDERLEQFERHLLRQTALVQFQRRANNNNRTTGVVDSLAEQVLPEATLLTLDHVRERLQRALVGARDRAATTTVVEQCINRLLQHALLVANNDVRSIQLEQAPQTVVTVDNATVQIVKIRGCETAAIQRHERPQIRWQNRQYSQDHPLRLVA